MYTNIIERSGTHATIESTTTSTQISDIPNDCIHCVIRAKLKISTLYPKRLSDAIETNLYSKFLKIFHSSISCRLLNIPPNLGSKSNYFERFYFFFLILCLEQHIISPKWIVLNELTLADELKNCFQCQFV